LRGPTSKEGKERERRGRTVIKGRERGRKGKEKGSEKREWERGEGVQ